MKRIVLVLAFVSTVGLACGDDGDPAPTTEATSPVPSSPQALPPTSPPADDGAATDPAAQAQAIIDCLAGQGLEAELDDGIPTYDEEALISVTFVYEAITVPGAVEIYLYPSEEAAATAKQEIDANLLEGDSPTVQVDNAVVDDFGTTLQEPEAEDQGEAVFACLEA